jgi:repressor LexA
MKGLTRRQQDVLNFIEEYIKSRGYPPSVREIASHFSLVSASGVHKHVKALVRKNFLAKQDFTSRSIRVLKRTPPPRLASADTTRWPFYGTLSGSGLRPRTGEPSPQYRPSDPNVSSGGIVVVVEGADFALQGIQSGDVLFVTAQLTPNPGDLMLVERGGAALLSKMGEAAELNLDGLRGVVVGFWRPVLRTAHG